MAQLDRAPDYGSGGREFESSRARIGRQTSYENIRLVVSLFLCQIMTWGDLVLTLNLLYLCLTQRNRRSLWTTSIPKQLTELIMDVLDKCVEDRQFSIFHNHVNPVSVENKIPLGWGVKGQKDRLFVSLVMTQTLTDRSQGVRQTESGRDHSIRLDLCLQSIKITETDGGTTRFTQSIH